MFDVFETLYDLLFFSIIFLACFEGISILFTLGFATLMPAWLSGIFSFTWAKLPLAFLFAVFLRYITRSKLQDMSGGYVNEQ